MSRPVTEIAYLPLKAGADPADPNTAAGKIWQESLATTKDQPGCQRIYWGTEVETPSTLWLFIDWNSHDAHIQFTKTTAFGPFVKNLGELMGGKYALHHVAFNPHPASYALSKTYSPATEVFNMYFPASYSSADQEKHAANLDKLGEKFKGIPGMKGYASGWTVEDSIPYEKAEGGTAKAFTVLIGWDSVDAHNQAKGHEIFKENIGLVSAAGGIIGTGMYHVNFEEVEGRG